LSADDNSEYLTIARIRKVQGRRGEIGAEVLTDFPERFQPGARLMLVTARHPGDVGETARQSPRQPAQNASQETLELEGVWFHKGLAILKFCGVDDISAAEKLVGREVRIAVADRKPLAPGEFYLSDLIGCTVFENSIALGKIEAVEDHGAAPLLQVASPHGELLIPFAEEICTKVDLARKEVYVKLPPGLKELNQPGKSEPRT